MVYYLDIDQQVPLCFSEKITTFFNSHMISLVGDWGIECLMVLGEEPYVTKGLYCRWGDYSI